jgi:uncharacterized protein (PEP-CTERM system associated)
MWCVSLKRGSKMRYLLLCVLLVLTHKVSATDAFQGEWVVSPTLDVAVHQSDISSDRSDLVRGDTAVSTELSTSITYKSKQYSANIEHKWTNYRYSDTEDVSVNYQDIRLSNTLRLWRDDLSVSASYQRYHELRDTIRGSFVDELYSQESQIMRYRRDYALRYELPTHNDVDLTIRHAYQNNEATLIDGQSLSRVREFNSENTGTGYNLASTMVTFGQHKQQFPTYWRVDINHRYQERSRASNVNNYDMKSVIRAPLWGEIKFAGIANYTEFQNGDAWLYSEDDSALEYSVLGAGIAWVKSDGSGYVQLTHNWEQPQDRKNIGVDSRWRFEDRWTVDYRYEGRFYGNSQFLNLNYTGSRHKLILSYSERVEVRFFLDTTQNVEGIYVCREDDDGLFSYDDLNCFIPPSGQYNLQPDQAFVPNIQLSFPLEARLTLWNEANFSWGFDNGVWEHQFSVTDVEINDLEFDRVELVSRGEFTGNWRHSSNTYTQYVWKMRSLALGDKESRSVENFYSVGYHYELNRRAEWALTLQHINKNSTEDNYTYDDNRVTLSYRHFFGKKHKEKRSLFP